MAWDAEALIPQHDFFLLDVLVSEVGNRWCCIPLMRVACTRVGCGLTTSILMPPSLFSIVVRVQAQTLR